MTEGHRKEIEYWVRYWLLYIQENGYDAFEQKIDTLMEELICANTNK